jgi:hypothetical protein
LRSEKDYFPATLNRALYGATAQGLPVEEVKTMSIPEKPRGSQPIL